MVASDPAIHHMTCGADDASQNQYFRTIVKKEVMAFSTKNILVENMVNNRSFSKEHWGEIQLVGNTGIMGNTSRLLDLGFPVIYSRSMHTACMPYR